MTDYEYLCSIILQQMKPLPITEEEKLEVMQHEWEMEQMNKEEEWPPYDIALEL